MTNTELAAFIIKRWREEHSAQAIMIQAICLGAPVRKSDVLWVIREWVKAETENRTYKTKKAQ